MGGKQGYWASMTRGGRGGVNEGFSWMENTCYNLISLFGPLSFSHPPVYSI